MLNVAEGAGEFSPADKARFYRVARRSATECAAILDVCGELHLADHTIQAAGREHLVRIVAMLVRLSRLGTGTEPPSDSSDGAWSRALRGGRLDGIRATSAVVVVIGNRLGTRDDTRDVRIFVELRT